MDLDTILVVLVEPSHPGNIGAAARAMKTMGLQKLALVNPKSFPHQNAYEMASGAGDLLDEAITFDTLDAALEGCHRVFATSARPRELGLPGMKPDVCARMVSTFSSHSQVALVFGREHAGLTNDELLKANYHINIPANPDYSSLNLAQAVQIVCYELRQKILAPEVQTHMQEEPLATAKDLQSLQLHMESVMRQVDFLKDSNPKKLPQRVRRLISKGLLESNEVNILRGFLSQVEKAIKHSGKE